MNQQKNQFVIGQRYISHTEYSLGLGIVTELDGRQIIISFPATGETRAYAMHRAPLSRIEYQANDNIKSTEELEIQVASVDVKDGILFYHGPTPDGDLKTIAEWALDPFVEFTSPETRLINGQLDHPSDYALRIETLCQLNNLQGNDTRGLLGSRTQLLPHQIYIVHEVAKRHAPRVLLADEVGLGKTIEAGMILHHQIFSGSAQRVLIVVPDTLIHQWLVEMLRRFSLRFSIFDQSRYDALIEEGYDNPFESEQQILCTLSTLLNHPNIQGHANSLDWDLIVFDEAHHLAWNPDQPSDAYLCAQQLSDRTQGLLLLTATPEQGGVEGHYARLHLLDPDRFHSLEAYLNEESQYSQVRGILQQLLDTPETEKVHLDAAQNTFFIENLGEVPALDTPELRQQTIEKLMDIHGPGREVFRNTRKSVSGFPIRRTHRYPLALPDAYTEQRGATALTPEMQLPTEAWTQCDTRVAWLVSWLKNNKHKKSLLICHADNTAIEIDKYLNLKVGIRSTAFYEGLSIIERDRAAAYFSDEECGAQILICSEIGSEGRNFQFLQDLILFDLPLNPDLLEQRIGRLDRIGQQDEIQIHIPYFEKSPQGVLLQWYDQGLNQFDQSFSAGYTVFQKFTNQLDQAFEQPKNKDHLDTLINETAAVKHELSQQREAGRDALLELNSCRPSIAQPLIDDIQTEEASANIQDYICFAFDRYGVNYETHSEDTLILSAGDDLKTDHFPGLEPDGMTVTFDRSRALNREDFHFLTWEHPLIAGTMDMIFNSELGNACVSTLPLKKLPPASLFLEVWYNITCSAPKSLGIDHYLSLNPTRFLMDANGKNLANVLPYDKLTSLCKPIKKDIARTLVQRARSTINQMLGAAHAEMETLVPEIKQTATEHMHKYLGNELARLESLSRLNPSIRQKNLDFVQEKIDHCSTAIDHAQITLQALKLMITTD